MERENTKRIIGALILTAVLILVGLIIPLTLGLGTQSINDEGVGDIIDFYQKFYWSLIVIWAIIIAFILIKKNNKYGDSIGFFNIGRKPSIPIFKNFTGFQLTILSTIVFSTLFLIANFLKLGGGTALRVLPQQFSPTQSLLFSTLLIPVSENLLLGSIIGLFILAITLVAIKYKLQVSDYTIYLYVGMFIVAGLFGVIWHSTAYPDSDIAKYVVFFFWGIGGIMSLAVGFFIPFLIMHMTNNFFIDAGRLYSSDALFTGVIIFIVSMIALYIALYRKNLFGQKKRAKELLV